MAGQRINIMEVRTLISLKQKGWSNRKIAAHIRVNRKTVDSYISRFKALELSCEELLRLEDIELLELFTEDSQTEKERYETLAGYFSYFEKELLKPGCTLAVLAPGVSVKASGWIPLYAVLLAYTTMET